MSYFKEICTIVTLFQATISVSIELCGLTSRWLIRMHIWIHEEKYTERGCTKMCVIKIYICFVLT